MDSSGFFRNCVYYPLVWARGQAVPAYLEALLVSQFQPRTALQAMQREKLVRLLAYARERVPFHMRALREVRTTGKTVDEILAQVPFTTRHDLRDRAMLSRDAFPMATRKTSGGSTGEPVTLLKARDAMARELAATWRGYSWASIRIGDAQARFWGVPLTRRQRLRARLIDFATHRHRCSAFAFDANALDRYTQQLVRFRPSYFYGYVSMIVEYAKYFESRNIVPPFALNCIVTTSEVLSDTHRRLIERVFATRVFDEYGSGELGSVAHECSEGSMHLSAENMIVEVLDGERRCANDEIGELVVTELNNRAMPLIRYRTGDFAALASAPCACGRTLPVIHSIFGRAYDIIRNSAGRMFHGEFIMYIFEEAQRRRLGVRAFQVEQIDPLSFRARIVPAPGYGADAENFIVGEMRRHFDARARVLFERVERIERSTSGKMRLILGMSPQSV